jgi:predicted DNA-binding protein (MmcQ/YjbR family)
MHGPADRFLTMTAAELRRHCLSLPGASEDFPFRPETSVFRVNKKIFAISPLEEEPLTVSVKADPELAASLRVSYDAIVPGYHLNKRHWLTVTLGADAPDDLIKTLIEDSHELVSPRE